MTSYNDRKKVRIDRQLINIQWQIFQVYSGQNLAKVTFCKYFSLTSMKDFELRIQLTHEGMFNMSLISGFSQQKTEYSNGAKFVLAQHGAVVMVIY